MLDLKKTCFLSAIFITLTLSAYATTKLPINWPTEWMVFGPIDADTPLDDISFADTSNQSISIQGKIYKARKITSHNNKLDFRRIFSKNNSVRKLNVGEIAIAISTFSTEQSGELYGGAGADWWMKMTINNDLLIDTLKDGNGRQPLDFTNHAFSKPISKGQHLIRAIVKSGSLGWKFEADGGRQDVWSKLDQAEEKKKLQREYVKKRDENIKRNSRLKAVIFGSSVAYGYGAKNNYGWANRLGDQLKTRNWDVINQSIGGDKTGYLLARIDRDLLELDPDVVIIGLSLANEGIKGGNKGATYQGYIKNMKKIIQICQKNNIIPVIGNCYPNDSYKPHHVEYIRKFNEELGFWPVYSIDLMGASDNGNGQWVDGYAKDAGHPNDLGHEEMTRSVPVSVFDHLIDSSINDLHLTPLWNEKLGAQSPQWSCEADRKCRSITIGFELKTMTLQKPSPLASIGPWSLTFNEGSIELRQHGKRIIKTEARLLHQKNQTWFAQIGLSYSYGRKTITLTVNEKSNTFATDHFESDTFSLYGASSSQLFRNAFWYYSARTPSQLHTLFHSKRISKSSLALFSPLDDQFFAKEAALINFAPTSMGFLEN